MKIETYTVVTTSGEFVQSCPNEYKAEQVAAQHLVETLEECAVLNEKQAELFWMGKLGELK